MKKIYDFGLFLEAKKTLSVKEEVEKEVRKIISEFFENGKNVRFLGNQSGLPTSVEFEVNDKDYGLDYSKEDMEMEWSENVLKKRKYHVSLDFDSKANMGTDKKPILIVKFKIKLKPVSEIEFKKEKDYYLVWTFENKPTKIIDYIESQKKGCEWDKKNKTLLIRKSVWDKLATEEVEEMIEELEGDKLSNKKIVE